MSDDFEARINAWKDLYDELDGALSGSAKEMNSVAERLVAVSYDFQATEDQIEATLKSQADDVKEAQAEYN